jgi:5,10-methylenetetrahydromethanopterin reductase
MTIRLGMGFAFDLGDVPGFCETARAADEAGFAMVGCGDSPAWLGDVYVGMSLIAQHTERCRVVSWVTNPRTRHPLVAAAAIATVDAVSQGRAVLGVGTGETGVHNLGVKRATLAQLEDFVGTVRDVWNTGEFRHRTGTAAVPWAQRRIPVYLATGGPKGLRLAGRVADGVIIESGVLPEVIYDSLAHLRAGAAEAGRRVEDIDVWWHVRACLAGSKAQARALLRSPVAGMGNRSVNFGVSELIPADLRPRFAELNRRYDMSQHGPRMGNGPLVDELGLTDYLLERWSVGGTPLDFVDRLRQLEALGVNQLAISGLMADKTGFVRTLGAEVLQVLNDPRPHHVTTSVANHR